MSTPILIERKFSHALVFEMTRAGTVSHFDRLLAMFGNNPDRLEKFLSWLDRRGLEIRRKP